LALDRVTYPGRLGLVQRVLPSYRAPFFDALGYVCLDGLQVFAGRPRRSEAIATTDSLLVAGYSPARNLHLLRGPLYLCYQRGLTAWLASWNPDALIVEANPRYLSTPAAVRWMKRRERPVIGWGLGVPGSGGMRALWRGAFLGQFDAMITYSSRGAQEYAALGFPAERIFVAPNAVAPRPERTIRTRPLTFAGRPSVLFVGRLQARKRVDLLLQACAALPEDLRPDLTIIGDGPERADLEALAARVYPAARFPGAKQGAELVPYFTAADLFVLPGTGGLAVQEAMSYGLPVVMGAGDGTNDDLVRPGNGWQLPPDDLAALTQVLRQALSDPARLRSMGAESYRIVEEEVNLERMVAVFVQALESLR
jgi:glycosyltransferase involved in cell wall biosynthesis